MERLIIFTSHYPFGAGEPFLEEEIRIAESCFNEITIVTYAKSNEALTRYIPKNAKVIHLRKDSKHTGKFVKGSGLLKNLFRITTWKEICNGIKERGSNQLITIIKYILLFERHIDSIKREQAVWMNSDPCHTVFYSYWLNAAAVYLSRLDRLNDVRICRAHGGDCFFDREYVPWRKDVLKRIDKVFTVSAGGKDDLTSHYKKHVDHIEKKIDVARLGVNIPEKNTAAATSDGEAVIVSCSNIIPLKRLDLLINALADESVRHHIRWVHFGDGPQLEEILSLANELLDHSDYVTYEFKGRTPKTEIMDFYRENNVALFINCSDVEGIPVSIMEAMSYGIPAVARDVGSNREIVNENCGALLPSRITPRDLASCIDRILDVSGESMLKMRKAAIETVKNNYDCIKNYTSFFHNVEIMLREKADE